MADNILIAQPNSQWAKLRAIDTGGGILIPVINGPYLTPEAFGAKGDGVTNDTVAFQSALNSITVLQDGMAIVLRPGATYLVDNITIPNRSNRGVAIVCFGMATIKSSGLGDPLYLIASNAYVANSGFANWGLTLEGVVVDGDDTKDYALVLTTARSRITRCWMTGGNLAGCYLTERSQDGTLCASVVDNHFYDCLWLNNAGRGLLVQSEVQDIQVVGGNAHGNTLEGVRCESSAGVQVTNFTTYDNTLQPGAVFAQFGFGTSITGCTFDGGIEFLTVDGTNQVGAFIGNTIKDEDMIVTLGGGVSPVAMTIDGTRFQGPARLVINWNGSSRSVHITGGSTAAVMPVLNNFPTAGSKVIVDNWWSKAAQGYYNGIIFPAPTSFTDGNAPNKLMPVYKNLNAGTTTDVVIVCTLPVQTLASSIIEVKLTAVNSQTAGTVAAAYRGYVEAGVVRLANATNSNYAVVRDENSSGPSGMSAAASWGVVGGAGVQTATLTITLTHVAPSSIGNSLIMAEVSATHRFTTAMTAT